MQLLMKLAKLSRLMLGFTALCENAVDILVEAEIDLRAIWLDEQEGVILKKYFTSICYHVAFYIRVVNNIYNIMFYRKQFSIA